MSERSLVDLRRDGEVFVVTLDAGQNRWTTALVRELDSALAEVEASQGAAALVTVSSDPKFFSNGLDIDWWRSGGHHRGGDRAVFIDECLPLFARMIRMPVPTVCGIGGHAFGAGFMWALCHDLRLMNEERGLLCVANRAGPHPWAWVTGP
jgi:enoyl-CoA hydratase/carnithine racemase